MVKTIKYTDSEFEKKLASIISDEVIDVDSEINSVVRSIILDVFARGDDAVLEYTNKFDSTDASDMKDLTVTEEEIDQACAVTDSKVIAALELAKTRIYDYHVKQMPEDITFTDAEGVILGNIWRPLHSVGIYVPGGMASYPSSVLMNAIPAIVAGVSDITMVVPSPGGELNSAVLAAAKVAGIDKIFKVGGAQAVAALAKGTDSITKVDKIVGPGNAYVAAAKRQLFGFVGIDMIAGPSEILVVADNKNDPAWIAADLLSQAEHDKSSVSILVTDDEVFASNVVDKVEEILANLERQEIARSSWENKAAVIIVEDIYQSYNVIDLLAPEHLELAVERPKEILNKVSHAGAVFLGRYTPEALGDYVAGPSHVLPTSGSARFSSGLSVFDFLKRMSTIECGKDSFAELGRATDLLASCEGLGAHALSASIRLEDE